jgi:hypothetical protein
MLIRCAAQDRIVVKCYRRTASLGFRTDAKPEIQDLARSGGKT